MGCAEGASSEQSSDFDSEEDKVIVRSRPLSSAARNQSPNNSSNIFYQRNGRRHQGERGYDSFQNQALEQVRLEEKKTVEYIIPDCFTGEGIKMTPAYRCLLSKDKLKIYREEFWGNLI